MPIFLATSDPLVTVEIVFGCISVLTAAATVLLTIWLFNVSASAAKVDKLETTLSDKQDEVITLKVAAAMSGLSAQLSALSERVGGINQRLCSGDEEFSAQRDKRESFTLQITEKFGELRHYMAQTFCTREDLERHEQHVTQLIMGKRIGEGE